MLHTFHLCFYCQNRVSEVFSDDQEYMRDFLEDLANRELVSFRPRAILIVKVDINFIASRNMHVIHFHIWGFEANSDGQGDIEAEVEARLSLALVELFGGDLPLFVEHTDNWRSFA